MLDVIFTPVRVEKSSALLHFAKERRSRQGRKNQELDCVYPKACCKISSSADSPDIVGVRPQDEHPMDMNTVVPDSPDAGNDILPVLFLIVRFECRGINGFKTDVQSVAARVS